MEAEGRMVGLDLGWVVRPWRWQASHLLSTSLLLLATHTRGPQVDKPGPSLDIPSLMPRSVRRGGRPTGCGARGARGTRGTREGASTADTRPCCS